MKTRVQKWGNSLAVRIPKAFAAEAGLVDEVQVFRGAFTEDFSASTYFKRMRDLR